MYEIAILDDEVSQTQKLHKLIDVYFDRKELLERRVDVFHEGVGLLNSTKIYDLLFLDIEVGNENGIEIARELRKRAPDMIIIVITGYLKYSMDGYKIQAARYLLKPILPELLYSELDEVLHLDDRVSLILEDKDQYKRVRRRDVLYLESEGRKVRFHCMDGSFISKESLSEWESRLDSSLFVECHKGILVHVRWIQIVRGDQILLENGQSLPLARRRVDQVKKVWLNFQENFA